MVYGLLSLMFTDKYLDSVFEYRGPSQGRREAVVAAVVVEEEVVAT